MTGLLNLLKGIKKKPDPAKHDPEYKVYPTGL